MVNGLLVKWTKEWNIKSLVICLLHLGTVFYLSSSLCICFLSASTVFGNYIKQKFQRWFLQMTSVNINNKLNHKYSTFLFLQIKMSGLKRSLPAFISHSLGCLLIWVYTFKPAWFLPIWITVPFLHSLQLLKSKKTSSKDVHRGGWTQVFSPWPTQINHFTSLIHATPQGSSKAVLNFTVLFPQTPTSKWLQFMPSIVCHWQHTLKVCW